MEDDIKKRTIKVSYEEFQDTALDAITDMMKALGQPQLGIIATTLCVDISRRLFDKEELIIEEDE